MENFTKTKEESLQVVPQTGIAQDYKNDFVSFASAVSDPEIFSVLLESGWKPTTYSHYLEQKDFLDGNNEQTQETIAKLDAVAEALGARIDAGETITPEDITKYADTMNALIYGK